MTEENRPEGTLEDERLICPHCQNDDLEQIYHGEYVLKQRRISNIKGKKRKTLVVDADSEEIEDTGRDEHFFCDNCNGEFGLPQGVKVDFE